MAKLSIKDLNLAGKRVFIRVDFNVPIKDGKVEDDTRIRASLPTIQYAIDNRGRVILASHLGRPKGERVDKYSLKPVAEHLSDLLGKPVAFANDCIGDEARAQVEKLDDGDVLLLENLRFHKEEEKNDDAFARELASLCNLYVNDAFGAAHRAHASTVGITKYVAKSAAGLLMEKELEYLG
ncbi:MAG TPA: phosphoglycerate kinase, partial [Pyrinomonadaceae bacterium]|nr:phosphoglycerate kinase [Pyrinomonadaceae bacterium]